MAEVKQEGKFTTIHREDGKIVLASQEIFNHVGLHGAPGAGSIFSGGIKPEMIIDFLSNADIPDSGGGLAADFPAGGYLLVAPFDVAMQFKDATVKEGAKEDFDPKQKKMVPVPIAEVHTTQKITDFATDETTVLVFPYDPARSTPEQNAYVEGALELNDALKNKKLYALATAFPGGFSISEVGGITFPEQQVPKATAWGGIDKPSWAVIIPDSQAEPVMERWNKLAGLK